MNSTTPKSAFQRLIKPLVRFALAHGLRVQDMIAAVKAAAVDVAVDTTRAEGRAVKVSHIAMMTGLQRREVKARLDEPKVEPTPSPVARVIGAWPRDTAMGRAEFDSLVAGLSQDMHPRTTLDEMIRLGVAEVEKDVVRLKRRSLVAPGDAATQLGYLAANTGDHTEAAVANVLGGVTPFLDQAVHYNGLTEASVARLEDRARSLAATALETLNDAAKTAQDRDRGRGIHRIRFGAYFYHEGRGQ